MKKLPYSVKSKRMSIYSFTKSKIKKEIPLYVYIKKTISKEISFILLT